MRYFAKELGYTDEEEFWGIIGLLHDLDFEKYPEHQSRIFERFYRVDKTRDRETGGTGLGLSITHATIMMHKGSIKVNSKEEEGTTILVRIPLKQQPAAQV